MKKRARLATLFSLIFVAGCNCVCDDGSSCLENEENCFNTNPPKIEKKMQAGGGGLECACATQNFGTTYRCTTPRGLGKFTDRCYITICGDIPDESQVLWNATWPAYYISGRNADNGCRTLTAVWPLK